MARAKLKKPGKYTDVYEACLYGDDESTTTTAAPPTDAAAGGTAVSGRDGGGDGGKDADKLAMPPPPPPAPPLLPPSGWRALSRNGAEGEISRYSVKTVQRRVLSDLNFACTYDTRKRARCQRDGTGLGDVKMGTLVLRRTLLWLWFSILCETSVLHT